MNPPGTTKGTQLLEPFAIYRSLTDPENEVYSKNWHEVTENLRKPGYFQFLKVVHRRFGLGNSFRYEPVHEDFIPPPVGRGPSNIPCAQGDAFQGLRSPPITSRDHGKPVKPEEDYFEVVYDYMHYVNVETTATCNSNSQIFLENPSYVAYGIYQEVYYERIQDVQNSDHPENASHVGVIEEKLDSRAEIEESSFMAAPNWTTESKTNAEENVWNPRSVRNPPCFRDTPNTNMIWPIPEDVTSPWETESRKAGSQQVFKTAERPSVKEAAFLKERDELKGDGKFWNLFKPEEKRQCDQTGVKENTKLRNLFKFEENWQCDQTNVEEKARIWNLFKPEEKRRCNQMNVKDIGLFWNSFKPEEKRRCDQTDIKDVGLFWNPYKPDTTQQCDQTDAKRDELFWNPFKPEEKRQCDQIEIKPCCSKSLGKEEIQQITQNVEKVQISTVTVKMENSKEERVAGDTKGVKTASDVRQRRNVPFWHFPRSYSKLSNSRAVQRRDNSH